MSHAGATMQHLYTPDEVTSFWAIFGLDHDKLILSVDGTGALWENHRLTTSYWQPKHMPRAGSWSGTVGSGQSGEKLRVVLRAIRAVRNMHTKSTIKLNP